MASATNRGRVLLALDISPRSRLALDLAAALAADLGVELAGLFVEDVDLLRLSGLPFAREVGLLSPAPRTLDLSDVEQAMRREATQVRRLLEEAAGRRSLRWSFHVARGRIASELFAMVDALDVVVIGKRPRVGLRPDDFPHGQQAAQHASGPVLVVCDASATARRALQLAAQLARAEGVELRLLPATDAEYARCVEQAKTWLAAAPGQAVPLQRCPSGNQGLAVAVRQAGAGVLVLDGGGRFRHGEGFAPLLNDIDCPVVLVN